MATKYLNIQALPCLQIPEDPQRIVIAGLCSQNRELRRHLKRSRKAKNAGKARKTPTIEIYSNKLDSLGDQELRMLVARFADSLRGRSDARIFLNGKPCLRVDEQRVSSTSSTIAVREQQQTLILGQGASNIYQWLSETLLSDDTNICPRNKTGLH